MEEFMWLFFNNILRGHQSFLVASNTVSYFVVCMKWISQLQAQVQGATGGPNPVLRLSGNKIEHFKTLFNFFSIFIFASRPSAYYSCDILLFFTIQIQKILFVN